MEFSKYKKYKERIVENYKCVENFIKFWQWEGMKEYHFQENNDQQDMHQTIRLDEINQQVQALQKKAYDIETDELGDAQSYLDAFASEQLPDLSENMEELKEASASFYAISDELDEFNDVKTAVQATRFSKETLPPRQDPTQIKKRVGGDFGETSEPLPPRQAPKRIQTNEAIEEKEEEGEEVNGIEEELNQIEKFDEDFDDIEAFEEVEELEKVEERISKPTSKPIKKLSSVQAKVSERNSERNEQKPTIIPIPKETRRELEGGGGMEETFWNKKNVTIASMVAVLLAMLSFFVGQSFVGGSGKTAENNPSPTPNIEQEVVIPPVEAEPIITSHTAIVQNILDNGQLIVYQVEDDAIINLSFSNETAFSYNGTTVFSAEYFEVGDILLIERNEADIIEFVGTHEEVTERTLTKMEVDHNAHTITTQEGEVYSYHKNTAFLYKEEAFPDDDIKSIDTLRVYLIDDMVWHVDIMKSHGYLELENMNLVTNGSVQLNGNTPMTFTQANKIYIQEGRHTLRISGDNVETTEIIMIITAGETFTYDLQQVQEKLNVLLVQNNVSDYEVYIDDKLMENNSQIVLPLGQYHIKIKKEGYLDWSDTISITDNLFTLNVHMEKEIQFGKVTISSVTGASVYINDAFMGNAPLVLNLPYEAYDLRVEYQGFHSFSQTINIQEATSTIEANLMEIVITPPLVGDSFLNEAPAYYVETMGTER